MVPTGDADGLTLKSNDSGRRLFLDVHAALTEGPDKVLSLQVVKGLISVLLALLQHVPFSGLRRALASCKGQDIDVSEKDVERCYHGFQAQGTNPCWSTGEHMSATDVKPFEEMVSPF